jgi:hypothetical protein
VVCILGIVEMLRLAGRLTQEPSPTADNLPWAGKPLDDVFVDGSSLPRFVSLLVAGEVADKTKCDPWFGKFECSKLSILAK